jgi:prolyl-tRNA synthetase
LKGVPVRIAIGPKDLEKGTVEVARRDTLEKEFLQQADVATKIEHLLEHIQQNLFQKAIDFREENSRVADSWDEFVDIIENKAGFVYAHWDGSPETEEKIKDLTKATIRCIPLNRKTETGKCVYTGNPSQGRVVFARAY